MSKTYTANVDQGWTFDHWEGDLSGSENPTTITLDGDKSVTAVFTQDQYSLSITTVGSGTVASNPNQSSYLYNQDVILTATPSTDWLFSSWTGDISSSSNPKTINIINNTTVTANFEKISDGLSASLGSSVIMFNFIYEICTTLSNELPVGVTVSKLEFFNGSNSYVNGTSSPIHLNGNWLPANSEIRVGLSFQIGQPNSYFSGWKAVWTCMYNGKTYYITGYYGLGKASGNQIELPLIDYNVIEGD